jgi:hypothetical protein
MFLPASLCHRDQSEGMIALALLDTGARDSKELNLISRKLADKIVSKGGQTYVRPSTICAMYNICKT